MGIKKRIVNFTGQPPKAVNLPQKIVSKYSKSETLTNEIVPLTIKDIYLSLKPQLLQKSLKSGSVSWEIVNYSDGSNRSYVLRVDNSLDETNRNKYQYFIGNRYLPGDGYEVISIVDDASNGIWTLNSAGQSTHIQFVAMSSAEKAFKMVNDYRPYLRYGLASGT